MRAKTIIYLHGFGSSGDSQKSLDIRKQLKDEFNVISPTLSHNPATAISEIRNLLANVDHCILIGTSLGGFYADYFNGMADVPAILINPLVDIDDAKKFIGLNKNFGTGKSFYFLEKDFKDLQNINNQKKQINYSEAPEIILLSKDDEVLDYKKSLSYFHNENQYISLFQDENHRFNNIKEIVKAVSDMENLIEEYDFYQIFNESFNEYKIKMLNNESKINPLFNI